MAKKKSNKWMWFGLGMMAAGYLEKQQQKPTRQQIAQASAALRAEWERRHADTPPHLRRPELANFDPLIPLNPTSACGLTIGDRVYIDLTMYQGAGRVIKISTEFEKTRGTKLYPMFQIRLDDGIDGWFGRGAMQKID